MKNVNLAVVIPAKAGIHGSNVGTSNVFENQGLGALDSGLRRNDGVLGWPWRHSPVTASALPDTAGAGAL